jgi:hypothetical protein
VAEAAGPPQSDRDLASIAEARALARRAKQAWLEVAEFDQARIDAIVDAMAAAATAQAEAFARLAVEETGYGVVEDKIQKNLFSSEKVYQFIRPMKTVGVIARHDDRRVVEIAEPFGVVAAVIPDDQPDVHRHLQDPDLAESALHDCVEPSPFGREMHHAGRRGHGRGGATGRGAGGIDQLDDHRHARGDAGTDEAARRRRDSGDGRHGARSRRLQCRQTGLRRGTGQRPGVHRADRERPQGRARRHHREDVRQRRAVLV